MQRLGTPMRGRLATSLTKLKSKKELRSEGHGSGLDLWSVSSKLQEDPSQGLCCPRECAVHLFY